MTAVADPGVNASSWGGERKSSVALFVSRGGATGISFLINLYLAKALGPTEYGTYSFALGLLTFIGIFFDFGYFAAAARLMASASDERAEEYTGAVYVLGLGFSVVFAVLVFTMSRIVDHIFQVKAGAILLAIAALSPAMIAPYLFEQTLKATARLYLLGIWVVATKLLFAAVLVWVAATHRLNAISAAVAQMAGGLAAILIVLAVARPYLHKLRDRLRDIRDEQARFGRPLYVGKVANLGAYHTDKLLLAYFATAREVGWYMLAMAIAGFVSMFAQSVAASGFRGFSDKRVISPDIRRWNTIGIIASSLAVVSVGSIIIFGYLGSDYRVVPVLLIPAVVATAFQGAFQPYNSWLLANGLGIELRHLLFIVAGVNLVANLLLIPTAGVYGAAIASVIGQGAYWYLVKRAYSHAIAGADPSAAAGSSR
jgi:O-antigen/teichoic acid export membrane protein